LPDPMALRSIFLSVVANPGFTSTSTPSLPDSPLTFIKSMAPSPLQLLLFQAKNSSRYQLRTFIIYEERSPCQRRKLRIKTIFVLLSKKYYIDWAMYYSSVQIQICIHPQGVVNIRDSEPVSELVSCYSFLI
jgi:hypothetical protein